MHAGSTPQSGWMSETASTPDPSGIHFSEPAPPATAGSLRDFAVATSYSTTWPPEVCAMVLPSRDHTGPSPAPISFGAVPSARISHTALLRAFFGRSIEVTSYAIQRPSGESAGAPMRFIAARSSNVIGRAAAGIAANVRTARRNVSRLMSEA
jgi:hypothetical protein